MLNPQGPVLDVGCAEVAIHSEGVAGAGIRRAAEGSISVATLHETSNTGWIDSSGLILPGQAGTRDGYTRGHQVPYRSCHSRRTGDVLAVRVAGNDGGARGYGSHTQRDGVLCVLLGHEGAHRQ